MRKIKTTVIQQAVSELCIRANTQLRSDVLSALKIAYNRETKAIAKDMLEAIINNAIMAKRERLAICQDTGLPCVFVELGNSLRIVGDLRRAINDGVKTGYKKGYLRKSMVTNPLLREGVSFTPPVIHLEFIKGDNLNLTVLPKGFGCENKARLKMFLPTASVVQIKQFIIDCVREAGSEACPPFIVGIGIGGTADYACLLAKMALLEDINKNKKTDHIVGRLKKNLLSEINQLNIGPMGLGGRTTCLGVNIRTYPTHIAGLPVAVNISCHALRSATIKL